MVPAGAAARPGLFAGIQHRDCPRLPLGNCADDDGAGGQPIQGRRHHFRRRGEKQDIILPAVQRQVKPVIGELAPQGIRRRRFISINNGGHAARGAQLAQVIGQPVAYIHCRADARFHQRLAGGNLGTGSPVPAD